MTNHTEDQDLTPAPALAPETERDDPQSEPDTIARPHGPVRGRTPLLAKVVVTAVVIRAQGHGRFLQDQGLAPETGTVGADHIVLGQGLDQITGRGVEVARVLMIDETAVIAMIPHNIAGDTAGPVPILDLDLARPVLNAVGRQSMRKSANLLLQSLKG